MVVVTHVTREITQLIQTILPPSFLPSFSFQTQLHNILYYKQLLYCKALVLLYIILILNLMPH